MSIADWVKDPNSTLDFSFDWSDWVEGGDSISSFEIIYNTTTHTGQLLINQTSLSENIVTVWLSAGRKNMKYMITCRVTTVDGRVEDSTRAIKITNK